MVKCSGRGWLPGQVGGLTWSFMNAGGSTFWVALVASLGLAGLGTWTFLSGSSNAPAEAAVSSGTVEAAPSQDDVQAALDEAGRDAEGEQVEADVTFSFAEEVVRFEGGEVLEQDDLFKVSCRDGAGTLLWDRAMDAPLLAGIRVDANDDGPEEFILVDSRHGVGLDPSGLPIPGFEIKPSAPITAFSIVDYDGDGQERYLFGLADGRVLNHRLLGEATPGWRHESKGTAIQAIAHLRAGRKDYICTVDEAGVVMLLKRNGQRRVRTAAQLQEKTGRRAVAFQVRADIERSLIISRNADGRVEARPFGDGVARPANDAEEQLLLTEEARLGTEE